MKYVQTRPAQFAVKKFSSSSCIPIEHINNQCNDTHDKVEINRINRLSTRLHNEFCLVRIVDVVFMGLMIEIQHKTHRLPLKTNFSSALKVLNFLFALSPSTGLLMREILFNPLTVSSDFVTTVSHRLGNCSSAQKLASSAAPLGTFCEWAVACQAVAFSRRVRMRLSMRNWLAVRASIACSRRRESRNASLSGFS